MSGNPRLLLHPTFSTENLRRGPLPTTTLSIKLGNWTLSSNYKYKTISRNSYCCWKPSHSFVTIWKKISPCLKTSYRCDVTISKDQNRILRSHDGVELLSEVWQMLENDFQKIAILVRTWTAMSQQIGLRPKWQKNLLAGQKFGCWTM